jgi:DNA-binding response OmpR family regulator
MKILIVEDDVGTAELLQSALRAQHYLVDVATDGLAGWELIEAYKYDLLLFDVCLPKQNGVDLCKQVRAKDDRTPILLLTAQNNSEHRVIGLDSGADDYLTKPYKMNELLARIRALLRRGETGSSCILEWGPLQLDLNNCVVTCNKMPLKLTAKEYAILELLLRNTHRIFSQSALIDRLWSLEEYPNENTVRAHVKSLRQKINKAGGPADFIETVYGLGYRLKSDSQNLNIPNPKVNKKIEKAASVNQSIEDQLPVQPELNNIWSRNQSQYLQRTTVLKRAAAELQLGALDPQLQLEAQKEAHTLKGSLGSFGLSDAENLCHELEAVLQKKIPPKKDTVVKRFCDLVEKLQLIVEQPLPSTEPNPRPKMSIRPGTKLLLLSHDSALVEEVRLEAVVHGLQLNSVGTIAAVNLLIADFQPDIVVLDLDLQDSQENTLNLLFELMNSQPPIPVVALTQTMQLTERVDLARRGVRSFLQKPIPAVEIVYEISRILIRPCLTDTVIMVVDDDLELLDLIHEILKPWGFKVTLVNDPKQFWNILEQTVPDLLILDLMMPDFDGIDLCRVVRNEPSWSSLPILFFSATEDSKAVCQVFTAGADDFISKPIVGPNLVARILNRLERSQTLSRLSHRKT